MINELLNSLEEKVNSLEGISKAYRDSAIIWRDYYHKEVERNQMLQDENNMLQERLRASREQVQVLRDILDK